MATILIKNGRCTCDCGGPCPLGKLGFQSKCTREELEAARYDTFDQGELAEELAGKIKVENVFRELEDYRLNHRSMCQETTFKGVCIDLMERDQLITLITYICEQDRTEDVVTSEDDE